MTIALDSEALSRVARSSSGTGVSEPVLAVLTAAVNRQEEVLIPAAVLAELYRGGAHDQVVDACLSRFAAFTVVDTTRPLARQVGHVLAEAGRGSSDHVDATVVATAIAAGGAVIFTADADDLRALSADLPVIEVQEI